jgi:hypothetical protein
MLLRDAEGVGVEVASISLAEIEQQERALEGSVHRYPNITTASCFDHLTHLFICCVSEDRVAAALAEAEKRRRSELAFLKREQELKAQVAAERLDLKKQLHEIDINR